MDTLKSISIGILILALVVGLGWLLKLNGFMSYQFFAPKVVAVQNQVFHESQAYTDGMANDMADLRLQYLMAKDAGSKDAIRAVILQRFASYPKDRLSPELRDFYNTL